MLFDPDSGCTSPHSIDGVAFCVGTWTTSRISMVQVGQMVLDHYIQGTPRSTCSRTKQGTGPMSRSAIVSPLLIVDDVMVWSNGHRCYVLVECSARCELSGYDFDALHVVLEASTSDTL